MDFRVREAARDDYKALCRLFAQVDALHVKALPEVFQNAKGPARSEEFIRNILEDENAALFVAENGDDIVGLVHIDIRMAPEIRIMVPRRYACISDVIVREGFRRRGIGESLVERAQNWARDKGVTIVELNVYEFNRAAIAFYEKLGYTAASRKMWKKLSDKGNEKNPYDRSGPS